MIISNYLSFNQFGNIITIFDRKLLSVFNNIVSNILFLRDDNNYLSFNQFGNIIIVEVFDRELLSVFNNI